MIDPQEKFPISQEDAVKSAITSFEAVLQHGTKIELDHHLVYYTRTLASPLTEVIDADVAFRLRVRSFASVQRRQGASEKPSGLDHLRQAPRAQRRSEEGQVQYGGKSSDLPSFSLTDPIYSERSARPDARCVRCPGSKR